MISTFKYLKLQNWGWMLTILLTRIEGTINSQSTTRSPELSVAILNEVIENKK